MVTELTFFFQNKLPLDYFHNDKNSFNSSPFDFVEEILIQYKNLKVIQL